MTGSVITDLVPPGDHAFEVLAINLNSQTWTRKGRSPATVTESDVLPRDVRSQNVSVVRTFNPGQTIDPAGHMPASSGKDCSLSWMAAKLEANTRSLSQADDSQRGEYATTL